MPFKLLGTKFKQNAGAASELVKQLRLFFLFATGNYWKKSNIFPKNDFSVTRFNASFAFSYPLSTAF